MVQDLASLLWVVNLGCIDLNQWYARCDDTDRPDYLHFDLDPGEGAGLRAGAGDRDRGARCAGSPGDETAGEDQRLEGHSRLCARSCAARCRRTSGEFAKAFAKQMEQLYPQLITAEYRVAKRPHGRVLVDYNQNAWGRTLASIYSVRPTEQATVSTPVTWEEVEQGFDIADFRMDNVPGPGAEARRPLEAAPGGTRGRYNSGSAALTGDCEHGGAEPGPTALVQEATHARQRQR